MSVYSGLTLNQYGVASPCPDLNLIHYKKRGRFEITLRCALLCVCL
ncbi:MAG: hypothetical protein E6899_06480 [Neisseria sp.]|nr:hypothetical protein [Neisseria sp.]